MISSAKPIASYLLQLRCSVEGKIMVRRGIMMYFLSCAVSYFITGSGTVLLSNKAFLLDGDSKITAVSFPRHRWIKSDPFFSYFTVPPPLTNLLAGYSACVPVEACYCQRIFPSWTSSLKCLCSAVFSLSHIPNAYSVKQIMFKIRTQQLSCPV